MELKISKKEVEIALLEWAEKEFPGKFNSVHIKDSYSYLESATFSLEQVEVEVEKELNTELISAVKSILPFIDDADDIQKLFPESAASEKCRSAVLSVKVALANAQKL